MKKRTALLISLLLIVLVALTVSVAGYNGVYTDPDTLTPSSDRVIFISDNYEGGDGTGSDALNPLEPLVHEDFDPTADYPKYHLMTAFYQATELLKDEGGTIVICGPVHLGAGESYGSGADTKDVFTASFKTNVIKFTSVYGGVDYRAANGAKLTIETPAEVSVLGSSIWENIDIETDGAERIMSFDEYPTLIGNGVKTYPADPANTNSPQYYVSLAAGHRYASSDGETTSLRVRSGTYNIITGAFWGTFGGTQLMDNAETNIVLEGTTKVIGAVYGTLQRNSKFGGNVNITVNGGTYECAIFGAGSSGFVNTDGVVKIKINSGDFTNLWLVSPIAVGHKNNPPQTSVLDVSDFDGDVTSYNTVLNVAYGFTTVIKKDSAPIVFPGDDQASVLVPSSDRVLFISDNYSFGDGTGSDASNPLRVTDHDSFDPSADYPKYHLMTSFYQATEMLKETGGTIVICGPIHFGLTECYGSGGSERDVFTAKFGNNVIKFTSVYNGVDYRETNGAKITIESPAMIGVYGSSIWENVDIETIGTNRAISFSAYETVVGDGIRCYPADSSRNGVADYYVSLTGGHRYEGGINKNIKLTVKSGTYNDIVGGSWGVNNTRRYEEDGVTIKSTNNLDGTTRTTLVLEGTTTVYGQIIGTTNQKAEFSGHTSITINGGNYECDIIPIGATGLINTDGTARVKINGGNFENLWSVSATMMGYINNAPLYALLDLSDFEGSEKSVSALTSWTFGFSSIYYPSEEDPDDPVEVPELNEPALTDPAELTPGSDKVIFISDDFSYGDGTGSDALNPLRPLVHEKFDPAAVYPKNFLMTAFYQATEMLDNVGGGTIVVCGPVHFGIDESYGSGTTTRDVETAHFSAGTIKITSVYNGVDYRETKGAKITIETPATMIIKGQTIWENIDIETVGTNRTISFCGFATRVGKGVNCYPSDEAFANSAANYVSLTGAHRYTGGIDLTTNLLVESGTYNIIAGGLWGVNNTRKYDPDGNLQYTNNLDGNSFTKVILDGTTTVLGSVYGTNRQNSEFSGNSLVIINGGKYYNCFIYGVSKTGLTNYNGVVHVVINGGDFEGVRTISDIESGYSNNGPTHSLVDYSGWQRSLYALSHAYNAGWDFNEIKLPEGITENDIVQAFLAGPGDVEHGDADGDGAVTSDDAIYLLYNVLFGESDYPASKEFDVDGNGSVSSDDAIYLLYHVLFGAVDYPLS